jgi:hypothetical protein
MIFDYFPGADLTLSHIMTSGYRFFGFFTSPGVFFVGDNRVKVKEYGSMGTKEKWR